VDVEAVAVVQREHDPLAAPCDRLDPTAAQQGRQVAARWRDDIAADVNNFADAPADHLGREGEDDGLDFGQFGHRGVRFGLRETRNFWGGTHTKMESVRSGEYTGRGLGDDVPAPRRRTPCQCLPAFREPDPPGR
jgi:hypothetical protein